MIRFWLVSFCVLIASWNARSASFLAEGVLEQYKHGKLTLTYNFSAIVDGCKWSIRSIPKEVDGVVYYEDSYDGENVYKYIQFTQAPSTVNTSGSIIERDNVPNRNSIYALPVWLAYGSSCYFENAKGKQVKPFMLWADPTQKGKTIEIDWKRSELSPFVPTYVFHRPSNRRYEVVTFTNFGGLTLPMEFKLDAFVPYSDDQVSPTFSMRGLLTNVTETFSARTFQPILDGKSYTEDRRITVNSDPVIYNNTNQRWLTTNDPEVLAAYREQAQGKPLTKPKTTNPVLIAILISTGLLIICIATYQYKRRQKS